MSKIKGGHMHLFLDGKSIAFSTTHTLSISAEAVDVSNKDGNKSKSLLLYMNDKSSLSVIFPVSIM